MFFRVKLENRVTISDSASNANMFIDMPLEERVPCLNSVFSENNMKPDPSAPLPSFSTCYAGYTCNGLYNNANVSNLGYLGESDVTLGIKDAVPSYSHDNLLQVEDMAFSEVIKDIDWTCTTLGIPRDPSMWSIEHVQQWIRSTLHRYNLPVEASKSFVLTGWELCWLREQEFLSRDPACGSTLHAQLEVWRNAFSLTSLKQQSTSPLSCDLKGQNACSESSSSTILNLDDTSSTSAMAWSNDEPSERPQASRSVSSPAPSDSSLESSLSTESETVVELGAPSVTSKPVRTKQIIHLWQFLKELLDSPKMNAYIRWIHRETGIFKIEDSTKVSQLWGKRKNRPAMNYDKLSRSVRQYYKKGIIKKTEHSKRLVYQFCEGYY